MARARNIKPGFFENEDLADCGPYAMLLFAGMWTLADREGRMEDRPRRIKAKLFSYFDVDIDRELRALQQAGFIERYTVAGEAYIQIPNFAKHQTPHIKEAASTIPAPDNTGASPVQTGEKPHETVAPDEHGTSTVLAPPDSLIPDTGLLDTDSLIADSGIPPSSPEQAGATAPETEQIDPLFLQFWAMYPTGRGKRIPALREWNKLKAEEKRAALERLPAFVACHDWQKEGGRFVRHAERWIKDRGWKDDVPPEPIRVVQGPQSRPRQGGFFAAGQSIDEERTDERQGNRHGAGDDYRALLADPEDGGAQRGAHGADLAESPGGYSVAATYRARS